MSDFPEIDLTLYSRLPPLDTPTTIALADRLKAIAPARPSAPVKQSLALLQSSSDALKVSFDAALAADPGLSKRPIDLQSDTAWWCIDLRLETAAAMPTQYVVKAPRAAELRSKLFPEGRRFLNLEYAAQWAEMDARMRLIDHEKLRPDLEALCGVPYVSYLYATHEQYRVMIGAKPGTPGNPKLPLPSVQTPLQNVRRAIVSHLVQLIAVYQAGGPTVKKAIWPSFLLMDEVREKALSNIAPPEKPVPAPEPAPLSPP